MLGVARPHGILVLHRGDRLHRVGAPDGGAPRLGEAEPADLAGLDQIANRAGDLLDGDGGVDAVLVEQVDAVGGEARERRLDDAPDVLRTTVEAAELVVLGDVEAELGRDDHLVPHGRERLADDALVEPRPVRLGGVEERHPARVRGADERDRGLTVGRRAVGPVQVHAPEPEGRDLRTVGAERARLHGTISLSVTGHSGLLTPWLRRTSSVGCVASATTSDATLLRDTSCPRNGSPFCVVAKSISSSSVNQPRRRMV